MAPVRPDWITARPVAHRGLHVAADGVIENTPSAATAAIAKNFAIECDVQISSDGEAMVFHDFTLDRLTQSTGRVDALTTAELGKVAYKATADRIVPLGDVLTLIGGRTPLVCEIKSRFDGDLRLTERTAALIAAYDGPVAIKSFDPAIVAHLRVHRARLGLGRNPLGIVAQARYDYAEWNDMTREQAEALGQFLHWKETQPDFLSWHVRDLPHAVPYLCREALGMPVMSWTVRTPEQRALAGQWADQIVFEGFTP